MPAEHFLKPNTLRPFFRHHTGQQRADCLVRVAQIAALQLLLDSQEIDLPAPVARRFVVGASGDVYTHEATGSAGRARVVGRQWVDEHTARITLADGRVIQLQLTGSNSAVADGSVDAIISIKVNDPEVSTWPPEKILQHAQLDGKWLCWERHWDDGVLQAEALTKAEEEARRLVDLAPDGFLMPDGLTPLQRSESVLHWVIKDILAAAGELRTPAVHEAIAQRMPDGRQEKRTISIPAMTLELTDVRVEYDLDGLIPDVMCRAVDSSGRLAPVDLMIEVAVTHRVGEVKKARIRERGLACIEFDVDLINKGAGRTTVSRLKSMVIGDPSNKRWINHPDVQRQTDRAFEYLSNLSKRIEEHLLNEQRQVDRFSVLPVEQALLEYLGALRDHWRGRTRNDGSVWSPQKMALLLEQRGLKHLGDSELSGPGGILWKLDTIRTAGLAGSSSGLAHQVFRRAFETEDDDRKFAVLILLALQAYELPMTAEDAGVLEVSRRRIEQSIQDGETIYARPTTWDKVIAALFPEMAQGLTQEFGTMAYAETIRRAQRKADGEQRAVEAARREAAEQKQQAEALTAEIATALDSVSKALAWAPMDGSIPLDIASAVGFARSGNFRSSRTTAQQIHEIVESAWSSRASGVPISEWMASRHPQSAGDVEELSRLLHAAWLASGKR